MLNDEDIRSLIALKSEGRISITRLALPGQRTTVTRSMR